MAALLSGDDVPWTLIHENSSLLIGTRVRCDLLRLRIQGETNWQHPGGTSKNPAYDLEHVALFAVPFTPGVSKLL